MKSASAPDSIYLDYASTTPVDPRVRDCMMIYLDNRNAFGNPSSSHAYGDVANEVLVRSASQVASLINARPEEIVWTSGATEADNLAILGVAGFYRSRGKHVISVTTEHKAVLESCAELERRGFEISYLQPDHRGILAPEKVAAALRPDTVLVSVMHANNETGVVQDIAAIGALCRAHGSLFHVDAAQSVGRLLLDMRAQQIDLLSLTAHKACGPKGIGALVLNSDTVRRVEPLLFGGGQQRALRPGTLATHQIAGMGAALEIAGQEMSKEVARVTQLRDELWEGIGTLPGVSLNGHREQRLCSILNISVAGVEGESLRFALRDLAVSSGSACNSTSDEPSYVLRSMGRSDREAEASLRFSLGRFTQREEVDRAVALFAEAVTRLLATVPTIRH